MRRKAIIPALALSAMSLGGFMVAGPVSAQDEPPDSVGGADPNESGITETADQPEAPEADDLATTPGTEVADVEEPEAPDTEVADVEEPEAVDPMPQMWISAPSALAQPADPADPPVLAAQADDDDEDDGDDDEVQPRSRSGGGAGATPVGGVSAGAGGMAGDPGTSAVPSLIAGGLGSALLASGAITRRRRSITNRAR